MSTTKPAPLTVESLGDARYLVTGGAEPHIVTLHPNGPLCDCKDFQFGKRRGRGCKHIDAVVSAQASGFIPPAAEVPGLGDGGPGDPAVPPPEPPIPGSVYDAAGAPSVEAGPVSMAAHDAERAVLSGILLAHTVPPDVAALLAPTMFARDAHRLFYQAMLAIAVQGDPIDPLTLKAALDGDLERAGGMEYIASLIDDVPTGDHLVAHARIVREHARRRGLVAIGHELAAAGADGTVDLRDVRRAIERAHALLLESATPRFRLLTVPELLALPAPTWLLDRFLSVNGLSVLYGAPGSGKSFVALGWALSIAAGQAWVDHPTQAGTVVYVAAEGSSGLGQRISAFTDSHELVGPDGIHFVREPVNLRESRDVDAFLAGAAALKPQLVVFDTLARCMEGGDENSPEDMGRVVGGVDRIRRVTGAHVLLVHHVGWSTNERPRGHSSLVGAADAVFLLKNDAGMLTLEFSKPHKDAPPVEPLPLRLVAVGTSCIIEPQDSLSAIGALEKTDRLALEALNAIDAGEGATKAEWREAATEGKGKTVSMGRATFYRCLKRLRDSSLVKRETNGKRSERYMLTGKGISVCAVS